MPLLPWLLVSRCEGREDSIVEYYKTKREASESRDEGNAEPEWENTLVVMPTPR